jgi:2-polyprenyl-3-methyl-5-hydroxy-6-metoxy-1,4-benzoquinol methylase
MDTCIICQSDKSSLMYQGLLKCDECNYVYADCKMSDDELKKIYQKNYFHGEEYSNYSDEKQVHQKNFSLRVKSLKKVVDLPKSKVLEIGCAYGFFMDLVKYDVESIEGVDVTEDGVNFAKNKLGLSATCGDFLSLDFNSKKYDLITMWDTIEHLPSPDKFIEKASKLINSGGHIAITTGDIESMNAKWRKQNWRLIHPPSHLHYFSKKSLTRLLEKNGFEVVHSEYAGFYRSFDVIVYTLFVLKLKWNWVYKLVRFLGIGKLNIYSNLYDIMYLIAQKK